MFAKTFPAEKERKKKKKKRRPLLSHENSNLV